LSIDLVKTTLLLARIAMKKILTVTLVLFTAWSTQAGTDSFTFVNGPDFSAVQGSIPDGNNSGTVVVGNVAASTVSIIANITVTLNITGAPLGGFAGDLYVQLTHAGGLSVLLNRPGKSLVDTVGYFDGGLSTFVLDDTSAINAHNYGGDLTGAGLLTPFVGGSFQPDGRTTDPLLVLDTDPINPSATLLGAFASLSPLGGWNLLLIDNQFGTGNMTLDSFTISVADAGGVPEPGTLALFVTFLGALPLVRRWRTKSVDNAQA
jgi:hypothetical protein